MKPIRSEQHHEFTEDAWTGKASPIEERAVNHVVSDTGGIDSVHAHKRVALVCGCLKPPGGYCSECNALVCADCFGHCRQCARPLGGCHSVFTSDAAGNGIRLCCQCHDTGKRRSLLKRFGRLILSPIIEFED